MKAKLNRCLALATILALLLPLSAALAQGNGNGNGNGGGGGGGGDEPSYMMVDLLGLPGWAIQSSGQFLTNRDSGGNTRIAGHSHWYLEPGLVPDSYPVLWRIDNQGDIIPGDPINLGIPSNSGGIELMGMNQNGVIVSITRSASEQDENGNWIFPSYVDVPGHPYQEMPIPANASDYPWLEDVNDNDQILGSYWIADPADPNNVVGFIALWQVEPDGSISGPFDIDDTADGQLFHATSINNAGILAGSLDGYPAIGWFENDILQTVLLDTSLQFHGASVEAMNDCALFDEKLTLVGQVFADANGDPSAPDTGFAWRPFDDENPTIVIGTFGGRSSEALDVNDAGQFVGWADTRKHGPQAFVFVDGEMKNLNSMVDVGKNTLQWANAINNDGDITGFMRIPRPISQSHGFLLRPIDQ